MKFVSLSKSDTYLFSVLLLTLVSPLLFGLYLQSLSSLRLVSIPLHAAIESIGSAIAITVVTIIFLMHAHKLEFNRYHRVALALMVVGVIDFFHALMSPGEMFVWLHSLSVFIGGIFFSLVWFLDTKVSKSTYIAIPVIVFLLSTVLSIFSILYPEALPRMLDKNNEFTDIAKLLNIIGGVLFVLSSFYFIRWYLRDQHTSNLIFVAITMLFGSAGILFFFSSLWDPLWWFWHTLRLLAFITVLAFMLRIYYRHQLKLKESIDLISQQNTDLKASTEMLGEYKAAIYKGSIISTGDLDGNITSVNQELLDATGYKESELIGQPHRIFRDPETPKSVFKDMWYKIQNQQIFRGLIKNRNKDGSSFFAKMTVIPILDQKGNVFEYLALREDVTELVNSQLALKTQFYTDRLTGLNNRFKFQSDLRGTEFPHLGLINIDSFKNYNDFYGMEFGDEIIRCVADRLLNAFYPLQYKVYRNHGDEFAVLCNPNIQFSKFSEDIAKAVANFENSSFKIDKAEINLQLSVGLVESSKNLTKADIALKEAKQSKQTIVCYSDNLKIEEVFRNNIYWSQKVKKALEEDRIEVVFQPIFNNMTESVEKHEALVRLIDENEDIISPFEFLEITKRSRLYSQVSRRVIKKALSALGEMSGEVSINICAEDIFDEETQGYLLNVLKEVEHSNRVTLELVESEGIEGFSQVKTFIDQIKNYGVKIAIDDFGTGYSNFEYLLKLKADYIKIDGSLIRNIDRDENHFKVVETMVAFAKNNNMRVVAEFVSTHQIQDKILELGIEYSQGYFIGRPLFLKELEQKQ